MSLRPIAFWILLLAIGVALAILLREILLPFVAGMALAYLMDPLASRLERIGLNRLAATLIIMALFGGLAESAMDQTLDGRGRRLICRVL